MSTWSRVALQQPALTDPYAHWAFETAWRGFRRAMGVALGEDDLVRVLATAPNAKALEYALNDCADWLKVAPTYRDAIPGGKSLAMHFTARLKREHLPLLSQQPLGLRWELAVPLREADRMTTEATPGQDGPHKSELALAAADVLGPAAISFAPNQRHQLGNAIAVIDFGCPFLNQAFANADGHPRISALWDQDERAPLPQADEWWRKPERADYGRELGAAQMREIAHRLRVAPPGQPIAENDAYRHIDYLIAYDDARRRVWSSSHGAQVLDLAGGTRDPLFELREGSEEFDDAGAAELVFVQLPALTAADSSGGSLAAHVLDGVRYVLDQCRLDASIVINLSYGTFAGPHDGSSLLETALAELLQARQRNFAIVLAAGNARLSGCHMQRRAQVDRSALLRVDLGAGDTTDTFLEVWYDPPPDEVSAVSARVRLAGGTWSDWVDRGDPPVGYRDAATGTLVAMVQHRAGTGRNLILLAVAPTAAAADDHGALAEPGVWEVEVRRNSPPASATGVSVDPVALNAWIERDDPAVAGTGRQSRFAATQLGDDRDTLSCYATGQHAVVVGGWRIEDGSMVPYSSLPATAHNLDLFVLGACEESPDRPGLVAAAVPSLEVRRMNGTSVAAPVVARQLFNVLARADVGRRQWASVLDDMAACSELTLVRRADLSSSP